MYRNQNNSVPNKLINLPSRPCTRPHFSFSRSSNCTMKTKRQSITSAHRCMKMAETSRGISKDIPPPSKSNISQTKMQPLGVNSTINLYMAHQAITISLQSKYKEKSFSFRPFLFYLWIVLPFRQYSDPYIHHLRDSPGAMDMDGQFFSFSLQNKYAIYFKATDEM